MEGNKPVSEVFCMDNMKYLKTMPDNSVDAIVTDPPYGLSFMGKKWDYDVPSVEIWKECLRVLKPGGYLLSFAGTRTQHRMACNIEDAGFEIRDMIMWVYGSGFPKSLNIGKAVDKIGGQNLSWFIDYILKFADEKGISRKELTMIFPSKNGLPTGWLWNKQNTQGITVEQFNKIKDFLKLPFDNIEETKREVLGVGKAGLTAGTIANFSGEKEFEITHGTSEWEGWGTSLKPAVEPITVARKPIEKGLTIAQNCLKWGVGGINIDGCRVEILTDDKSSGNWKPNGYDLKNSVYDYGSKIIVTEQNINGRFPANLIIDDSEEVVKLFPNTGISRGGNSRAIQKNCYNDFGKNYDNTPNKESCGVSDSGSASRFFYCAKSSQSERNLGCENMEAKPIEGRDEGQDERNVPYKNRTNLRTNQHPTVKPIALMEYLIKLVSREGQIVLDPFAGSGTTGIACINLKREYILIEREKEYYDIIINRLKQAKERFDREINGITTMPDGARWKQGGLFE